MFQIVLHDEAPGRVKIKRSKDAITMTIPKVKKLLSDGIFWDEEIARMLGLGFTFNKNRDVLTRQIVGKIDERKTTFNTLLAILVFEIFRSRTADIEL